MVWTFLLGVCYAVGEAMCVFQGNAGLPCVAIESRLCSGGNRSDACLVQVMVNVAVVREHE